MSPCSGRPVRAVQAAGRDVIGDLAAWPPGAGASFSSRARASAGAEQRRRQHLRAGKRPDACGHRVLEHVSRRHRSRQTERAQLRGRLAAEVTTARATYSPGGTRPSGSDRLRDESPLVGARDRPLPPWRQWPGPSRSRRPRWSPRSVASRRRNAGRARGTRRTARLSIVGSATRRTASAPATLAGASSRSATSISPPVVSAGAERMLDAARCGRRHRARRAASCTSPVAPRPSSSPEAVRARRCGPASPCSSRTSCPPPCPCR